MSKITMLNHIINSILKNTGESKSQLNKKIKYKTDKQELYNLKIEKSETKAEIRRNKLIFDTF